MKNRLFLVGCLLSFSLITSAQQRLIKQSNPTKNEITKRTCGSGVMDADYENWLQPLIQQQAQNSNKGTATVYNIPVVFHIIHNGSNVGSGLNISDAQILSQLAVLNEDFRKLNADTATIQSVFAGVSADCEINFCLAQTNPQGGPTTGIDRINYTTIDTEIPQFQKSYIDGTIKPNTIWNTNNYLNIWVVPDYNDNGIYILGHATFPAGSGLSGLT